MLEALFNIQNCMLACEPTTMLAMAAVMSVASTGVQYIGQKKAAKEKEAYQNHLATLVNESGQRKASALIAQNLQRKDAAARKTYDISQEAAKLAAESRLASSASGVAGLSVDHLESEIFMQQGAHHFAIAKEQGMADSELGRRLLDIDLGTEQQMASTLSPIQHPSALGAALKMGSQAAMGYASYNEAVDDKKFKDAYRKKQLS
jgi:hypothetical protein